MADLKNQVRELAGVIESKKAEAAAAWSAFDSLKKSAQTEGVDFTSNTEAFEKLDSASKTYDAIRDEVSSLESKRTRLLEILATDGGNAPVAKAASDELAKSFGERWTKSDVYAQLKSSGALDVEAEPVRTPGVKIASGAELKTLLSTTDGGSAWYRNDRLNVLVPSVQPALNLLDVIPTATTDSDTVEWVREYNTSWTDGFTNAAAEIAESTNATPTTAADSTLTFGTVTSAVREIAHFIPVTKKQLQDASGMESYINQRLIYGLRKRLQSQIVGGNGTAPNLRGLVNTSGIQTQARGTDSRADAIHKAVTKIRINSESLAESAFIGLHPTDLETLRLEKATSGDYYFGGPAIANISGGTIWGLTPIVSTAFTQGTAVVFDPAVLTLFYHASGLSLSASDSHSTFFVERKVALLASLRAALAVYQPNGICTVTSF